jgi:MOSC domain-containing protein YiiM
VKILAEGKVAKNDEIIIIEKNIQNLTIQNAFKHIYQVKDI